MEHSRPSHPIQFADTFTHSFLLGIRRDREYIRSLHRNIRITQRLSTRRYACRFAALTDNADAAPCCRQLIDGTHGLKPRYESVKGELRRASRAVG